MDRVFDLVAGLKCLSLPDSASTRFSFGLFALDWRSLSFSLAQLYLHGPGSYIFDS